MTILPIISSCIGVICIVYAIQTYITHGSRRINPFKMGVLIVLISLIASLLVGSFFQSVIGSIVTWLVTNIIFIAYYKYSKTKRIEYFFELYKKASQKGMSKKEAIVDIMGEFRGSSGAGILKEEDWWNTDTESRIQTLSGVYNYFHVEELDVFGIVGSMIRWEYPNEYNKKN